VASRPEHRRNQLRRALRYVDHNPTGDLSTEAISRVAALSKFHFLRRFRDSFGVTAFRNVHLARLKRASYRLAFRPDPVIAIALDCGYQGPEAFARAFRRLFGQSPRSFRQQPHWPRWTAALAPLHSTRRTVMHDRAEDWTVEIIDFPETRVAVLPHRGDPALIGETVRRFIGWRRLAGLPPRVSATFNVFHADPAGAPPEEFRLDLCASTTADIEPNADGVVEGRIAGGCCAVLRLVGPDDALGPALTWLVDSWLPASGEERRDAPLFCRRVRFFPDVEEHEAVTDLYLPVC